MPNLKRKKTPLSPHDYDDNDLEDLDNELILRPSSADMAMCIDAAPSHVDQDNVSLPSKVDKLKVYTYADPIYVSRNCNSATQKNKLCVSSNFLDSLANIRYGPQARCQVSPHQKILIKMMFS